MEQGGEQRSQADSWDRVVALPSAFGPQLESLLQALLEHAGIRVHSVTHRVKTLASAQRKVSGRSGRYAGVADLHDILGLRVITYFSDEVDAVANLIRSEFDIDEAESVDKGAALDPDRFGYRSEHFIGTLNSGRAQLPEYARFTDCRFEVQVRSILQHAWAEVEHDLGYKSPVSVSPDIRRRFSRLAGLFEIADSEFVAIREDIARHIVDVKAAIENGQSNIPIDRDSLLAFMSEDPTVTSLDKRITNAMSASLQAPTPIYAEWRIPELRRLGIRDLSSLRERLLRDGDDLAALAVGWLSGSNDEEELPDDPHSYVKYGDSEEDEWFDLTTIPNGWDPFLGRWESLPPGISLFYLYKLATLRAEPHVEEIGESKRAALAEALEVGRAVLESKEREA